MRVHFAATAALVIAFAGATSAGEPPYARFPTIHGDTIVFAAEGDLFTVPAGGGRATRLTTREGEETFPKFSPDGKWLAFSSEYQGNVDVWVMPAEGGEPRRLTFHPAADQVVAWRPDSKTIVFRSTRETANRELYLYEVDVEGGPARKLEVGTGSLASFSPDGKKIAFNRWSTEFRTWKRYRGGTAPDIWVGDLESKKFAKVTDWDGTDDFPMWQGDRIYFLSDRAGRANVFSMKPDGSDVKQHTQHSDLDARFADAQGGRVVYTLGGDIWLLDAKTGEDKKVDVTLPSDRTRLRPRFEDASKTLESYALDRTGRRIAVASRGDIFIAPPREGHVIELTQGSAVRDRAPAFSPDGKSVAFITDETGEQEIAIADALHPGKARILTHRGSGWLFAPVWSPDGKKLAYADMTHTLFVVDVASGESKAVDKSPIWEIREYVFSPDSKWLAYSAPVSHERAQVFVHELASGKSTSVSTDFADDGSPAWDPKGEYLFFISQRHWNPIRVELERNFAISSSHVVCAAILAKDGASPALPEDVLRAVKKRKKRPEKKDDEKKKDEEKDEEEPAAGATPAVEMTIDTEGLSSRIVELPGIDPDNLDNLSAADGKLFYMSEPPHEMFRGLQHEDAPRRSLHVYDLRKKKSEVLVTGLKDYVLSGDGKKVAYQLKKKIVLADAGKSAAPRVARAEPKDDEEEGVDPKKLPLSVQPRDEWAQIFGEAWRLQRDFYWAENMAGMDWKASRDRYAPLLSRISTRQELNDLIGQMIAELGTSHTYVMGGDVDEMKRVGTGLLGADLAPDEAAKCWRIARVLRPEAWETDIDSPLTATHVRVQDGDLLVAIEGREVGPRDDVDERLAGRAEQWVELTVARKADKSDARRVLVKTIASEHELRYRDWCRRARERVEQRSGGRIGYFHLPDMGARGLQAFIRGYYPQVEKEALIIDDRNNGGGNVSSMIMERLLRKVWAFMRPRRGVDNTYPHATHQGPKVVLVNQHAGSDGDIFPESFKLNGLGLVIGVRTWGGVIGIRSDKAFVDGGMSTQPEFAWWEPKRGWGLENRGVEPDIVIDNLPEDELGGRDAQLDRAIDELLNQLEQHPTAKPAPPPTPDKSGEKKG